jgi:hypothetical protein
MPTFELPLEIQTAIVPELPPTASLDNGDKMIVYKTAAGQTCHVTIADLITLFGSGGGGGGGTSTTPSNIGPFILHVVTSGEANGTVVNLTDLAGKTFFLVRGGLPLADSEYNILSGGGFSLVGTGNVLVEGERFLLLVYELIGGSSAGSVGSTGGFKGAVSVSTNLTFDTVNHLNKLIQLRGGSSQLQFTLPFVDDIPDNTVIEIEAMITNSVEHKIQTSGAQNIYFNNTSYTSIGIRAGESIRLYRADDGYYLLNQDFAKMYSVIGAKPEPSYVVGLNELKCDGTTLNRSDYPRLWEAVQTFGLSLVDDADWSLNKGFFSRGNGTSTFRLPDFRDMFVRGANTQTPGTFQDETVNIASGVKGVKVTGNNTAASSLDSVNSTGGEFDLTHVFDISPTPGTETRPAALRMHFTIKC